MPLNEEQLKDAIDEGQALRGWISNGYAQVEYFLGDIIVRSWEMPEYVGTVERLPHRVERRIAKVHEIIAIEGFFSQFSDEIVWIIDGFSDHHQTRNLLAHGFCTVYHTPDGDFGLEFRKWHRDGNQDTEIREVFRLIHLEYLKAQLIQISERALALSLAIHNELGLVEP
jgi:hypothetical protein